MKVLFDKVVGPLKFQLGLDGDGNFKAGVVMSSKKALDHITESIPGSVDDAIATIALGQLKKIGGHDGSNSTNA